MWSEFTHASSPNDDQADSRSTSHDASNRLSTRACVLPVTLKPNVTFDLGGLLHVSARSALLSVNVMLGNRSPSL